MRVDCISANKSVTSGVYFDGHWEMRRINQYPNQKFRDRIKMVYIPDQSETPYQIAYAWKNETGYAPIDWIKRNNPYNQSTSPIQYEIENCPYLPIDVIKASVDLKYRLINSDEKHRKIDKYIELAKLAAQVGDKQDVLNQEKNMAVTLMQITDSASKLKAVFAMDNYKPDFGTTVMDRIYSDNC